MAEKMYTISLKHLRINLRRGKEAMYVIKILRLLIAAMLILISFYAEADDKIRVEFGGWSRHAAFASGGVTNESHDILGVEFKGVSVGKFNNSYGRETWFAAKVWRWEGLLDVKHLNGVVSAGLNKGYRRCYGDDNTSGNVCAHGYVGAEYVTGFFYQTVKAQPGVVLYNLGVVF